MKLYICIFKSSKASEKLKKRTQKFKTSGALKPFLCFLLLVISSLQAWAESDSDSILAERMGHIEISLLTCQPHDEVYSLYGHTAIRMMNKSTNEDVVINYGVFNPETSFFVLRFVFGLTDYSMGVCGYETFLDGYRHYGSGVYEQRINMSPQEKLQFLSALYENSKPENVVYRYNYFYNNCTTKARDILLGAIDGQVVYKPVTSLQRGNMSFRQLIHLKVENHRWARMGNDLLLGVAADLNTSHDEREFLPEVLSNDFDSASVVYQDGSTKKLVAQSRWVVPPSSTMKTLSAITFPLSPFALACVVFFVILALVAFEVFCHKTSMPRIRYAIYAIYASVGIVLFLMLFSKHPTVQFNLQILVFNPLFFILALPKVFGKWGKYVILLSLCIFFAGNVVQDYAEGVNVLALSLLLTFVPIYFGMSKKKGNFAN